MIETDDLGSVPVDRLISAESKSTQEDAIERALRPRRLADYVGQAKIRDQLTIFIEAARRAVKMRRPMRAPLHIRSLHDVITFPR